MAYNQPKKKVKRPEPKMLGTGMARKAGEELKKRKSVLDKRIKAAGG